MDITREVVIIQRKLEKIIGSGLGEDQALDLLKALQDLPMNITVLTKTKITKTVNAMREKSFNENVISLIKSMTMNWKKFSKESSNGEEESKSSEKSSSKGTVKIREEDASSPIQVSAPFFPSKAAVRVRQRSRETLFAAIKGDGAPVEGGRNPQYLARILEERFQKTDQKYMDKIHSMISTLEDVRNCKLRNSFLRGQISPQRLVKITWEEIAFTKMIAIKVYRFGTIFENVIGISISDDILVY